MMEPRTSREVTLPVSVLVDLRQGLGWRGDPHAAAEALREAGVRYGETVGSHLLEADAAGPAAAPADFWRRLRRYLRERGWGTLTHERGHPAVGLLASADWAEAEGNGHGSCAFSEGVMAGLLSRAAGRPVQVREVECRRRGDTRCVFAFGSNRALQALDDALQAHQDLGRALEMLAP